MEFDIVINGGGLVGASLATALRSSGLKIGLIEGQALPGPKLLEKLHIAGGEGVYTTIPAGIEAGQILTFDQGYLQTAGFERGRKTGANQAATVYDDIELHDELLRR